MISRYDLVLLAVDSVAARLVANDVCVRKQKPLVDAGIHGLNGTLYTYRPAKTACLACYYGTFDEEHVGPVPSFAPIVSAISSFEALSAANILLGLPNPTDGKMLIFEGSTMTTEFVSITKNKQCPVCSI